MLESVWAVSTIATALVLGVAAIAKIRSPESVDRSFRDLDVPPALARPWMRRLFPWAELALAVALLVTWGWVAVVAAVAALALLGAYIALVGRAVAGPESVSCGCFGESSTRPVDWRTLVRNIALATVALALIVALALSPEARAAAWVVGAWAHGEALLGALIAGIAVGALALNGDLGPSPIVDDGLAPPGNLTAAPATASATVAGGPQVAATAIDHPADDDEYVRTPIPSHTIQLASGELVSLRKLAARGAVFLVYATPGCASCEAVIDGADALRARVHPLQFVLVTGTATRDTDSFEAGFARDTGDGLPVVFALLDRPWAVLLGIDGQLAGGPVLGSDAISEFADDVREQLVEAGIADTDVRT